MKVALVVQRYGADINGGAELHARYVAEHLARHVAVEVLTTCASDYITWRNERPAGTETVHGVPVRRFPVSRERVPHEFGTWSTRVFTETHSTRDELSWLEAEGPTSPALIDYIRAHAGDYDFFIFFSARYFHAFHGARAVPGKAILVPTAERDPALGLAIFGPLFRGVRGIMYNSLEERALIHGVAANQHVPGVVVGIGSEIPEQTNPARFRQKYGLRDRFAIYVGRIDENKGCAELFAFFEHYSSALLDGLHLVLIGTPVIPIPDHPRIHHLGFVPDEDKFDAIAASELLIMPSYFESLSMVALEAWALGKPVLANAACDVLHGQCLRSNGGLFYQGFHEFFETLRAIDGSPSLAGALGRNGQQYFRANYSWPVIEKKYTDMLDRLTREPSQTTMERLPGWWSARRHTLPPAAGIVDALPKGAARDTGEEAVPAASRERERERERRPAESPRPTVASGSDRRHTESRPAPSARSDSSGSGDAASSSSSSRSRGPRERGRRDGARSDRPARPVNATPPATNGQAGPAETGADNRRPARRRPMRGRRRPSGGR
ncbi:MAG: glycosyltransferase [Acidobacteria bacterium]|nr:glycosyltransferase [Acidobacteriota bacterium]